MNGKQHYDPFGYGSVQFGKDVEGQAAAESPEDMLFSDSALPPGNAAGDPGSAFGARDGAWDPLEASPGAGGLVQAEEFGAEILGEVAAPARSVSSMRPPALSSPARQGIEPPGPQEPWSPPAAVSCPQPGSVVIPARGLRPGPVRRPPGVFSVVLPSAILALGSAGTAWLHLIVHNPVMAALAGAITLVVSAIAWLSLRP
ncbi:MAG: hypothetical protein Fur0037_16590 [Planctomycetota bacterium]